MYLLTQITKGSLIALGLIVGLVPVVVLFSASIFFFSKKYKVFKPTIHFIDLTKVKELSGLGIKFFILQIASIIIFSTDNIIITQILKPSEVTPYNIAFKYFGLPIMIFYIITVPFWSAFTEAYAKKDIKWIKSSIKGIIKIWIWNGIGIIFLIIISNYFYSIWSVKT